MRHRFHALCPYFAMFPESFALRWISRLTKRDEFVLDPFSGRGTTALTAILNGRKSISSDVNDVAFCLTKAKTNAPTLARLLAKLSELERKFYSSSQASDIADLPRFFRYAFHQHTLEQILFLRDNLQWKTKNVDTMIAALALGALHGDSGPYYFSNQMPRTISTKPAYSIKFWRDNKLRPNYRDVFDILRARSSYRYESIVPRGESHVLQSDVRCLNRPELRRFDVRCVITSPPYLNVTNFEEDQWLRLWFLGGPDIPTVKRLSKDDRHLREDSYWKFISDMWHSLGTILSRNAHIVIRIGSRKLPPAFMKAKLLECSAASGRETFLVSSRVSEIKNRQTDAFRPGSTGCLVEIDCHFQMF